MKGYTIDCDYIIRVKDYMRIVRAPLILVSSGEDDRYTFESKRRYERRINH